MARNCIRLTSKQMFQLNNALQSRFKELTEARISQGEACKRLSEGLGFQVTISALQTSLETLELEWVRTFRTGEGVLSARELIEALIRDELRLIKLLKAEMGIEFTPSATLVRWQAEREEGRRRAKEAAKENPTQPLLPLAGAGVA